MFTLDTDNNLMMYLPLNLWHIGNFSFALPI